MAPNLFFNFFGDCRFEKRIYGFNEFSFNFSLWFYKKLNAKWNACVCFDSFFSKMAVDLHDSICKNVDCFVENVDGIGVIWGD